MKDDTVQFPQEGKEDLLTQHRMERDQEASIDDDMLFGTDSDDSFAKDYNITKDILRRERIYKRDKARFEIEKKQRETKRV